MRATLVMIFLFGVTGCGGAPSRFSSRSAASLETGPAPTAGIGIALREDPPLPGRSAEGWSGLAPAAAPMDHSHHGHMHHGGDDASEVPARTPDALAPDALAPDAPADAHAGGHHGH